MKKMFLMALGLCLSVAGLAQEETTIPRVNKNQDGLSLGVWVGPNYSLNENQTDGSEHNLLYMNSHSISAGGMVMASREFSDLWGWRASVGVFNNRGRANRSYLDQYDGYSFQDAEVFGDVTLDMTDLIARKHRDLFNVKVFAGVGLAYVFKYPKATDFSDPREFTLSSDPTKLHIGGRFGINATWRFSESMRLGLQMSCSMFDDKFNGEKSGKAHIDVRNDLLVGFIYTLPM